MYNPSSDRAGLVWRACPFASLLYGLDCVRLSPDAIQKFQNNVIRQLRTLCRAPVFITREPARDFLSLFL